MFTYIINYYKLITIIIRDLNRLHSFECSSTAKTENLQCHLRSEGSGQVKKGAIKKIFDSILFGSSNIEEYTIDITGAKSN